MTGYDNQPDYGGPPVTLRTWVWFSAFVVGLVAIGVWWL